jgi:hypothetical protein
VNFRRAFLAAAAPTADAAVQAKFAESITRSGNDMREATSLAAMESAGLSAANACSQAG